MPTTALGSSELAGSLPLRVTFLIGSWITIACVADGIRYEWTARNFDGAELCGTAGAYPLEVTLPGGAVVPASGVTAVGVEGTAWVSSSGTEAVFGIGDSLFGPSAASCWIRPLDLGPATSCNPDPTVATGLLAASADLNRILVQIFPTNTARYLALVDRAAGTITPLTGISGTTDGAVGRVKVRTPPGP